MSDRSSGAAPSRLVAVLGPTNTGKTHLAVERMLGHASGMIGLPLRLLAREVYDRIVKQRGARAVALITGEEKIVPARAHYFVCTVEAMPLNRNVEFLAVDEIQLCGDPARGHVFTHRLLHARGKSETMFLGAATMGPLIRRLLPECEITSRERFSDLSYAGPKKLTRLPRRSAIVAFSAENVYAIAELIRRQRGGAAVVMGSLSPRTRNAQVALYQSGEVDFLVATDAIGMGLNMDVDHVAFAGLRKFDGKRTRWLHPQEVGQIAGRAGRYRKDGTFGVTGEAPEMDADLVTAVQDHAYEPLAAAEWRNAELDYDSLPALLRSLAAPPSSPGLKLAEEGLDEKTLRALAGDPDVADRARRRDHLHRLWEVCQTPDFRKTTMDEHLRLVRTVFEHLTGARGLAPGRLPEDWLEAQFKALDHPQGEIDVLAQRLAGVRTLAYAANRPDWLRDPGHWQGRTRALEERLSDTLHERLMQRFIDRRTSALLRSLSVRDEVLAGVGADGAVTVEGQLVGRLVGLQFDAEQGASALETKALRHAAERAVQPEITRRLGALAADPDSAFALLPVGQITWRGEAAGALAGGRPFSPQVRLFGQIGSGPPAPTAARQRAQRRLEAFIAAEASRRLAPLKALEAAIADGALKGLARGIAYRLVEAGGVIARAGVAAEVGQLSQSERRTLRSLGVRFGAFSLFLPALLRDEAHVFLAAFAQVEAPHWRPPLDRPSPLPAPSPPSTVLSALGLRVCAGLVAPVLALEQLDALLRAAPQQQGAAPLTEAARETLGWSPVEANAILRALGYAPARKPEPGQPTLWRRRREAPRPVAPAPVVREGSPFAALARLTPAPASAPDRRRPARARKPRPSTGSA